MCALRQQGSQVTPCGVKSKSDYVLPSLVFPKVFSPRGIPPVLQRCHADCVEASPETNTGPGGQIQSVFSLHRWEGYSFIQQQMKGEETKSLGPVVFHLLLSLSQPPQKVAGVSMKQYLF